MELVQRFLDRLPCPDSMTFICVLSTLSFSNPAAAYLGPGAGLGMIGSLIAIVVVALVVVLGLIIYPIRMIRKRKARSHLVDSERKATEQP